MPDRLSRRTLLGSTLGSAVALTACDRFASAKPSTGPLAAPLKDIVPAPFGTIGMTWQLDQQDWIEQVRRHCGQMTPEWEQKMERTLGPGFAYDFSASDRVVSFAGDNGLRVHGHTLIWYSQGSEIFNDAVVPRDRFAAEYERYIRAFQIAKEADPDAVLFLNEYNLENIPQKGTTFLKLVERLLKLGAPIEGIGTQSHLNIEIPAGNITNFFRDAASLGLPIHVSELDFSLFRDGGRMPDLRSLKEKRDQQVARVGELAEAFHALPESQRYAFTTWGLRDNDSWLTREEGRNRPDDSPVLLDREGRGNPACQAVVDAFTGRAGA